MDAIYSTINGIAKYYGVSPNDVLDFKGICDDQPSILDLILRNDTKYEFSPDDMESTPASDLTEYANMKTLPAHPSVEEHIYFRCILENTLRQAEIGSVSACIPRSLVWQMLNDKICYVELNNGINNKQYLRALQMMGAMFKGANKIFISIRSLCRLGSAPKTDVSSPPAMSSPTPLQSKALPTPSQRKASSTPLQRKATSSTPLQSEATSSTPLQSEATSTPSQSEASPPPTPSDECNHFDERGGCYLIQLAHECSIRSNIFKIGCTGNFHNRTFKPSPEYRNCRIIRTCGMSTSKSKLCEDEIIMVFNRLFTNVEQAKDINSTAFGTEYFEGDENDIIDEFDRICRKHARA